MGGGQAWAMGGTRWRWLTRDLVLFVGGLAGVVHETAFSQVERPALLMLYAGMMGLPAFLAADRRGRRNGNGTSSTSSDSDQDKKE